MPRGRPEPSGRGSTSTTPSPSSPTSRPSGSAPEGLLSHNAQSRGVTSNTLRVRYPSKIIQRIDQPLTAGEGDGSRQERNCICFRAWEDEVRGDELKYDCGKA